MVLDSLAASFLDTNEAPLTSYFHRSWTGPGGKQNRET